MKKDLKDLSGGAFLALFAGILAIILLLIFTAMAVFGFGFFSKSTADFRGSVDQTNRINANGAYRIAAYESFFNQCASIQGKEVTIQSLEQELTTNPPADRVFIINSTLTGLTASRASAAAQYNADSAKAGTAAQFKDSANLPYQIPLQMTGITTCAS